ncbi:MAG: GntR family transcriptional regulator [Sinobacteraceae bacterium]|nr:GntR family transcriptional regulator [Nevskiaceae bacterium]
MKSAPAAQPPYALAGGAERPPTVVQRTMRGLLRDIMAGVYGPGERIRETEAALRLGVSRASVREALRALEQDGLLEVAPWRGARVIDHGPEEIAELFELMGTVYGAVAKFAARHASDADLRRLREDFARLRRAHEQKRDIVELIDIVYQMGTHLGRCCGNPLAAEMLRKLGRLSYLHYRYLEPVPSRWRQQSLTRLRRLETALLARSEERSEKAARRLAQHTAKLVVRRACEAHRQALPRTALATPRRDAAANRTGSQPARHFKTRKRK